MIQQQNSSTPDRTTDYALKVLSGDIVAGPHVRNSCRRHIEDMKRTDGIYFDPDAAAHVFDFFEGVLKLSEGQFEGQPFKLHPSQAFIIGSLFGWKRADGRRRFTWAYIEQAKGQGKSPVAGGIGLFGMGAAGESGAEIYAAAARKEQAGILFRDACKMVRASPALSSRFKFSGGPGREHNIAHHKSMSFFRPVSRETGRTGAGLRPYFILADEIHEMPDRSILETLWRGVKFRREPLLFMITNSGSDRNSVAWEMHERAVQVAAGSREAALDPTYVGEVLGDEAFSFVCSLDEGDDPLNDPSCWIKTNPLLGVTLSEERLTEIVAEAKAIPGQLNGILRLHFCVWTDADVAWMARSTVEQRLFDFEPSEHHGKDVFIGLDLSRNRDITSMAAVVQTGTDFDGKPTFDAWVENWTPRDTMQARELRDKLPYSVWVREGHIHAPPGESISFRHVAQTMAEYSSRFNIKIVAYDRYAFRRFEEDVHELGLSLPFAEHPQGGTKKGKPIDGEGEGLWMPGSVRMFEEALLEGRIRLKRNPVLISAIMSSVTEHDKWGNHWLAKERSVNKIDPAVALCMAFGAANAKPMDSGPSVYEERGLLFL